MSLAQRTLSNSALLIIAEAINKVFRFALAILAARMLGEVEYGKFSFAFAFCMIFSLLADGGIHQLMVRDIARDREGAPFYLKNALVLKAVLMFLTFVLISLVITLSPKPPEVVLGVHLFALAFLLDSLINFFKAVFQSFERMHYEAAVTVISAVVNLGLAAWVLLSGGGFVVLILTYLATSTLALALCFFFISRHFPLPSGQVRIEQLKYMIREGFPFGLILFFATFYMVADQVLLSFLKGDAEVGWYSAAYRIVFSLLVIPFGLTRAIFPVLSRTYRTDISLMILTTKKAFQLMAAVALALALGTTLLADRIVLLIYGPRYINTALILKILVWSKALIFVTTVLSHTTRAMDQHRFTAKVVVIGALLNGALNLLLIPPFSYIGAAIAAIATEVFSLIAHFYFVAKNLFRMPVLKDLSKLAVANAIMGGVIYVMDGIPLLLVVGAAAIANGVVLSAIGYFTKADLEQVLNLVRRLRLA